MTINVFSKLAVQNIKQTSSVKERRCKRKIISPPVNTFPRKRFSGSYFNLRPGNSFYHMSLILSQTQNQ